MIIFKAITIKVNIMPATVTSYLCAPLPLFRAHALSVWNSSHLGITK